MENANTSVASAPYKILRAGGLVLEILPIFMNLCLIKIEK